MEQLGIVKFIRKDAGKRGFGYIAPASAIANYEKDVVFFENDLQDIAFESLSKGMEVSFLLESRANNNGEIDWFARQISLVKTETPHQISVPVVKKSTVVPKSLVNLSPATYKLFLQELEQTFQIVERISNSGEFEDAVFCLLRLMGIHTVYQYPREAQAGQADGFFILENLAVMYDCTLRESFEEYKQEQIENYINKLSNKSQLTIYPRRGDGGQGEKKLQIQNKSRQVWIITRGTTRELLDCDGIKVKEIAIRDLIDIAIARCKDLSYDVDRLSSQLFLLGN